MKLVSGFWHSLLTLRPLQGSDNTVYEVRFAHPDYSRNSHIHHPLSQESKMNREVGLMDLIYLDYNCFQRGFDDTRQIRIQMEALAYQEIVIKAEKGKVRLAWPFI